MNIKTTSWDQQHFFFQLKKNCVFALLPPDPLLRLVSFGLFSLSSGLLPAVVWGASTWDVAVLKFWDSPKSPRNDVNCEGKFVKRLANQVLKLSQMLACEKEAQDNPAFGNWKSPLHLCTCAKVSKSLKSGIKSAADAVT